ncbi:MAG: hypothetical protein WBA97_32455 [Actinophytocola sp.]|uniref:hypothetical protein n=1 Tax=Actinophytocola sp. TaxID=1872138 RepID=UPI003C776066
MLFASVIRRAGRRIASIVTVGSLVAVGALLFSTPAAAATALVECVGSNKITFSPPLTGTPTLTAISIASSSTCITVGSPQVTSATIAVSFFATRDCDEVLDGLDVPASPLPLTWNAGSSVATVNVANVVVQGQAQISTQIGTVTSGLFTGGTFLREAVLLNLDISAGCLSPGGLSEIDGTSSMTIVDLF